MSDLDFSNVDFSGINDEPESSEIEPSAPPLTATVSEAFKTNPDAFAKQKQLSRDTGTPVSAVEGGELELEADVKFNNVDFIGLEFDNPGTSNFLKSYDNAVASQDDISILQRIEDTVRSIPAGLVEGFGMGVEGVGRTIEAGGRMTGRAIDTLIPDVVADSEFGQAFADLDKIITPYLPGAVLGRQGNLLKEQAEGIADVPAERQNLATDIGKGLGQVSGQIVTALVNPTAALGLMFGQGVDQQGERQEASGAEGQDNISDLALIGGGAVTAVTEKMGLDALMSRIPPQIKNKIARQLADVSIAGGIEAVQEVVEGVAQGYLEQITTNADAEIFEGLDREAMAAGGVGVIVRSFVNMLTPGRVKSTNEQTDQVISQGEYEQNVITKLNDDIVSTKMQTRDADTMKAFIEQVDADQNTNIFIDGAQAAMFMQEKTPDEIAADPALEMIQDQVREAAALGGDVVIPIADFAKNLAGTDAFTQLQPHMTLSPEAVTPFRADQAKQETESYVKGLMTQAEENTSSYIESQAIYEDVKKQLIDSGQVNEQNAKVMAQVVPAWATVYAQKNGISIEEAYKASGLHIEGPQTGERARLEGELELLSQPELQQMLSMDEDAFIQAVNPEGKVIDDDDDVIRLGLGDFTLPETTETVSSFEADGQTINVVSDDAGNMYAVNDNSEVLGLVGPAEDNETSIDLVSEAKGLGVGKELAKAYLRKNPMAPAGGFTKAGEATYRAAFRELKAEQSGPQSETKEQFVKSRLKPLQDDVIYHGIRGENAKEIKDKILNEGFEIGQNVESLSPNSISFFTDKHSASQWGSEVIAMKIPEGINITDISSSDISQDEALNTGADAVTHPAHGGQEIRIYNPEMLKGVIFDSKNPKQYLENLYDSEQDQMLKQSEVNNEYQTGTPVELFFTKNTESAPKITGMDFGQDIEPAGDYLVVGESDFSGNQTPGWIYGTIDFKNPLVLEHKSTNSTGWKKDLSDMFDGKTGKQLSNAIKQAGYDGILTTEVYRGKTELNEAVNLSADRVEGNTDVFRQDQQNLFVAHNLSAENLIAANELGGLAAPSIAVARSDISDFSGFGEITLLANPSLLEDSKARTFDADVYTPRQPRATYKINLTKYSKWRDAVEAVTDGLNLSLPYSEALSEQSGADNMLRSDAVKYKWLKEQGKEPKLKNRKVDSTVKQGAKSEGNEFELRDDPKFIKLADKHYRAKLADIAVKSQERAERFEDLYYNDDGTLQNSKISDFANEVVRYRKSGGKDLNRLRHDISDKFRNEKLRQQFEADVTEDFNEMVDGKTLFKGFTDSGNKRYTEYNMANVVREMTQSLQGGETSFYGAPSVRSAHANEMKTIAQIQARRDQIIPEDDLAVLKEDASSVFENALEDLKPFYKFDADGWGYAEDAGTAIMEGPKAIKEAFNVTPEVKKIVDDLVEYLSALPSTYFEAKVQRAVDFSEFDTAVVPRGADPKAVEILKNTGVKIKRYDPKVEGSRAEVIAKQKKLLFQGTRGYYDPANSMIRLTEAADLSTFLHEFAHFMYEMELKAGGTTAEGIQSWFKRNADDVAKEANGYMETEGDFQQPAYHGTPHKFDNFSLDAMGTGEGAQAYGWGMYFAGRKSVAEFYRDVISPGTRNQQIAAKLEMPHTYETVLFSNMLLENNENINSAVTEMEKYAATAQENGDNASYNNLTGMIELIRERFPEGGVLDLTENKGQLYQVELPEDSELLDYDAPLDDQPFTNIIREITDNQQGEGTFDSYVENNEGGSFKDWSDNMMEDLSDQEISMLLNDKGVKGLKYKDADSRFDTDDSTFNYVIWDEQAVTIESVNEEQREAEIFAQSPNLPATPDGSITPEDVINYIDNDTTGDQNKDLAIRRAVHEQFARGFETYLMEGKAPSVELRNAFATFARWLSQIYKSIRGQLNVNLDDEMRQVLDRMLATEEQIEQAETRARYQPMFTDAAMGGMTDDEFKAYNEQQTKVKDKQSETLRDKLIKEITRTTKQWWKEQKADITTVELEKLKGEKVYITQDRLRAPVIKPDRSTIIEMEAAIETAEKEKRKLERSNDTILKFIVSNNGLNRESFDEIGQTEMKDANKEYKKTLFRVDGGMTPRDLAEKLNEMQFWPGEEINEDDVIGVVRDLTFGTNPFIDSDVQSAIDGIEDSIDGMQRDVETANDLPSGTVKLDLAVTKEMVGVETTNKLGFTSTRIPAKLNNMTKSGGEGIHPDEAAALFGYTSGAEMLNDLINVENINKVAGERAEEIMKAEHGDILNDGTIEKEADDAVQNEERGKLMLQELKLLRRGVNQPALERQTIKAMAEENIGKLSYNKIFPNKYRKAEIKAAQESATALANGDKELAANAKARQVLNYYLGMAATEARAGTDKIVTNMSRYNKKKVREAIMKNDHGYWEQIEKILTRFDFRKSATLKAVDEYNQSVESWMNERMETAGDELSLSNATLNELYKTHWKNVPYSTLTGISDSVKNIEHVARYGNKIDMMGDKVEFETAVADWTRHMDQLPTVYTPKIITTTEDKNFLRVGMAQMTKIPFLASWLDGGERVGMSHEIMMDGLNKAGKAEQDMWKSTGDPVMDAIMNRSKDDIARHMRSVYIPELPDGNMIGSQVLAVALNTGNAGNLRKMLLGEGWADPEVEEEISFDNPKLQAVLKHMTKSDWELVQLIWDQMDKLFTPLAEVHRKSTGLTPGSVEAEAVNTPYGTFKGGYYPVVYDHNRSADAARNKDRADAQTESMFGGNLSLNAQVNAGATNERTGYYGPINLNLDVIPNHFQETIHYITHHEPIRQLNRLITDRRVRDSIISKVGPDEYAQLKPWLNDIAKDGRAGPPKTMIDAAFGQLRMGVTLGVMGFKASTGIIQLSGIFNTYAEVGPKHVNKAMRTVYGRGISSIKDSVEFAFAHSNMMETRTKTMDREIKNALDQLKGKKGVLPVIQEASMKHIAYIQFYGADIVSWHAGYTAKLEETGDVEKAYKYADWVVENVQGSGATKDMATLMRNQSKTHTTFTMFMTFFSSLWNMERDLVRGGKSGKYSTSSLAAKSMFLFTLPVIFEMLMRGEVDDEDDEMVQKTMTKLVLYPLASVPFVRDVASGIGGDYGYNSSPVASVLEKGLQGTKSIMNGMMDDEEITKSQAKSTSQLAGAAFKIPGVSQVWATGEHIWDVVNEGEELTMHQLLFGPTKEQ